MKIALICPYDIHRPGGVQYHILDVATTLSELGHEVTVMAPDTGSAGKADAHRIVTFGKSRGINFNRTRFEISIALGAEYRRLADFLRDERFDVIHFHTIWTPILSFQILRLSDSANVATFHDTPPPTLSGKVTRAAFRAISWRLLPRLDGSIAVSEAPAGHLISRDGRRPVILPPCIDLAPFSPDVEPLPEYRDDRLNILYLGRMDQRKGIYQLLEAYRDLSQETPRLRLLVVGGGGEVENVRRYIAENGLEEVVMLGPFDREDAPRHFATADIFCSPALYGESFGLVLTEAMSCGKPVVAAANLGYSTVLGGDGAQFLVRPGDVGDLTAKLRLLISDPDLRQQMGAWGQEQAAKYDCRQVVPEIVKIYEAALGR